MSKIFQVQRLDVQAFASEGGTLQASDAVQRFARLQEEVGTAESPVVWAAQGGFRTGADGQRYPALHLTVQTSLPLVCQRCMGPVDTPLHIDRHFLFARDEATAERLDEEAEDDVLALARDFDLLALIEDELLMALPLVPRHDNCPQPLPMSAQTPDFDAAAPARENPFAALAALKGKKVP